MPKAINKTRNRGLNKKNRHCHVFVVVVFKKNIFKAMSGKKDQCP
jgi:hypothetical protein